MLDANTTDLIRTLVTSLTPLFGVVVGAGLGWLVQTRTRKEDRRVLEQERIRSTAENFVAAHRVFRRFLMQPETRVELVHNQDRGNIPIVRDASLYWETLDRATISFTMLPPSQEAKDAAEEMRLAWYALAAARASRSAGSIPDATMRRMKEAEEHFLEEVRRSMLTPAKER